MRIPKIKQKKTLKDMGGVWTWDQVTSQMGSWTMRYSWRVGPLMGAAAGAWMGIKGDLEGWRAAIAPVIATGTMFTTGLALKLGVNLFYASQIAAAQGNMMNLMEDYRDQNRGKTLERLWEKVFKYEPFREYLVNDHRAVGLEGVVAARTGEEKKKKFLELSEKVLGKPYPQSKQMEITGICWGIIENWLDAGPLEIGDRKIYDDWRGRASIQTIKKQTILTREQKMGESWKLFIQNQWHAYVTKSLAVNVGGTVKALNNKYDTDLFNAQTLLWPGEEDRGWVKTHEGAREDIIERRQYIIKRIFGADWETAQRKLVRMLNPTFELLTYLRAKFDPEYLQGDLEYTPRSDLESRGYPEREIEPYDLEGVRTKIESKELYAFLEASHPEVMNGENNVQAKRAVRIAFHTNRDNLKDNVLRGKFSRTAREDAIDTADYVLTREGTYSRRLVDLRVLHELSQATIDEYNGLVKTLGYGERIK